MVVLWDMVWGELKATGMRTKAAMVEGIKPCCYLKKKKNRAQKNMCQTYVGTIENLLFNSDIHLVYWNILISNIPGGIPGEVSEVLPKTRRVSLGRVSLFCG